MRRFRKNNGRTVKSMEMPWSLWLRVRSSVLRGLPGFEKTEAARDRIAEVKRLLAENHTHEVIARMTGLTRQRIGQIKNLAGTPAKKAQKHIAEVRRLLAENQKHEVISHITGVSLGRIGRIKRQMNEGIK